MLTEPTKHRVSVYLENRDAPLVFVVDNEQLKTLHQDLYMTWMVLDDVIIRRDNIDAITIERYDT